MIIDGRAQEQRDLFFLLFLPFQQLAFGSFPIMRTQQDWEQKFTAYDIVSEAGYSDSLTWFLSWNLLSW